MGIEILAMFDCHQNHEDLPSVPTFKIHLTFVNYFAFSRAPIFYAFKFSKCPDLSRIIIFWSF